MGNIISTCLQCKCEFTQKNAKTKYLKKFCTRSCSATYNNQLSKQISTRMCLYCDNVITLKFPKDSTKYCNMFCSSKHKHKKAIQLAKTGSPNVSVTTYKRLLVELHGHKCTKCQITDWCNNPLSLHLDHIDGNSDNNCLENLRLLCPNCHSQTETFCGRNKANTKRSKYNKRYRLKQLYGGG